MFPVILKTCTYSLEYSFYFLSLKSDGQKSGQGSNQCLRLIFTIVAYNLLVWPKKKDSRKWFIEYNKSIIFSNSWRNDEIMII